MSYLFWLTEAQTAPLKIFLQKPAASLASMIGVF